MLNYKIFIILFILIIIFTTYFFGFRSKYTSTPAPKPAPPGPTPSPKPVPAHPGPTPAPKPAPSNCNDEYEGKNCQCKKSDILSLNPPPSLCFGQHAVCQNDGSYKAEYIKKCQDLYNIIGTEDLTPMLQRCLASPGVNFKDLTCKDSNATCSEDTQRQRDDHFCPDGTSNSFLIHN